MAPLLDICHALDPVAFARERLNFQPDSKQALVLASRSKQVILNCTPSGANPLSPPPKPYSPPGMSPKA